MLQLVSQDLKATARRTLEQIVAGGDLAALAQVLHPNLIDHNRPPGAPPGREGMAWSMGLVHAGFSERRWELHQVIADHDTVALDGSFHGRHTGPFMGLAPTGRSVVLRQVHILRFQDGRGIEHWAVPDDLELARQLEGVIARPPSQPVLADALARLLSDLHP
jgi:predicted ester cyclase